MGAEVDGVDVPAAGSHEVGEGVVLGADLVLGQDTLAHRRLVRDDDHEPTVSIERSDRCGGPFVQASGAGVDGSVGDDDTVAVEENRSPRR